MRQRLHALLHHPIYGMYIGSEHTGVIANFCCRYGCQNVQLPHQSGCCGSLVTSGIAQAGKVSREDLWYVEVLSLP